MLGIQRSQLGNGSYPWRVVGCDRGTFETLVKDARTQPEPFRVICRAEDLALDLGMLAQTEVEYET
jgi:hypothetical protein